MPTALRLQREFATDLQLLLVDVQGDDIEGVERSKLEHGWMGTGAMWTTVPPIRTIDSGIPYAVMLDGDGRVVLSGYVSRIKKDIVAWLEKSREQRATPPADLPESLFPAWRALQRDQLAASIRLAESVDAEDGSEVGKARDALLAKARGHVSDQISRLERMVEDGEYLTAQDLVSELADFDERAAAWKVRLETGDLATEARAAKALHTLAQPLFEDGLDPRLTKAFEALAERHAGTRAAARAKRYAAACRGK